MGDKADIEVPETQTIEMIPWTGEQVDISKPQEASKALRLAQNFYYELRAFQDRCRQTLRDESDRLGQRTFETGGYKVEVDSQDASMETTYDVQRLWDDLLAAGLPVERLSELIHYEPKVDGRIIRQLVKNPAYQIIVEAAVLERSPKTRTVRVKESGA